MYVVWPMRCNNTTFFFHLLLNEPCFLECLHVQPVLSKAKLDNLQSMFLHAKYTSCYPATSIKALKVYDMIRYINVLQEADG